MRIAIDATCWNNRRGFGRFARDLIAAMATQRGPHELLLVADQVTAKTADFPPAVEVCIVEVSRPPIEAASAASSRSVFDLWRFRRAVVRLAPEAVFFPAVYSYFPVPSAIPTLTTFHDAIAENHPSLVFPTRRSRWFWSLKVNSALRLSHRIATVSQYSRASIAETFHLPIEDVAVIGEGVDSRFHPRGERAQAASRANLDIATNQAIILYVGGLSPHKNLTTLLEAAQRLVERGAFTGRLLLVGEAFNDPFHSDRQIIERRIAELALGDHVALVGYVSDDHLAALYSAARLLVLPSLDEGFGLPAAEAMACGTPVAASNAGALPEVVADGGVLFDPTDPAAMALAIERLLNDDDLHRRCAAAGIERARSHRWTDVADRVFSELERLSATDR